MSMQTLLPRLKNNLLHSGFLHTFAANFLTNMLAFGSVLVVAYFLTPADIADIRLMQAYTIIGITLASLGYTTGLLKACAESDDKALEEAYLKRVTRHTLLAALAYCAVLLALVEGGVIALSSANLHTYLPPMLLTIPMAVLIENIRNFLLAKKAFKAAANAQINVRILTFFIVIGASWAFGLAGFVAATLLAYAFGAARFLRESGLGFIRRPRVDFPDYFVRFSLFAMFGNLFVIIASYGDMFLLDATSIDRDLLGAYALASVLLGGLMVVTASVQTILLPDMLKNQSNRAWLRAHFIEKQLKLGAVSVVLALLGWAGVAVFFPLVYGADYALTPALFGGMCVQYVLVSCGTLGGSVMMGLGRTSVNTAVAGIALLAGFVFAYLVMPAYGIWGMVYGKILYGALICLLTNIIVFASLRRQS
ncbi:MAG: oligosaccharide flippase family protein [Proteobacteria bacterium]|nr:oligosaccharide flippase family protein [Pseudomonadota bacterium]